MSHICTLLPWGTKSLYYFIFSINIIITYSAFFSAPLDRHHQYLVVLPPRPREAQQFTGQFCLGDLLRRHCLIFYRFLTRTFKILNFYYIMCRWFFAMFSRWGEFEHWLLFLLTILVLKSSILSKENYNFLRTGCII